MARDDAESQGDDPGSIETGPVTKRTGVRNFKISNILSSTGIVIGPGSLARKSGSPDERVAEALRRLQVSRPYSRFMTLRSRISVRYDRRYQIFRRSWLHQTLNCGWSAACCG